MHLAAPTSAHLMAAAAAGGEPDAEPPSPAPSISALLTAVDGILASYDDDGSAAGSPNASPPGSVEGSPEAGSVAGEDSGDGGSGGVYASAAATYTAPDPADGVPPVEPVSMLSATTDHLDKQHGDLCLVCQVLGLRDANIQQDLGQIASTVRDHALKLHSEATRRPMTDEIQVALVAQTLYASHEIERQRYIELGMGDVLGEWPQEVAYYHVTRFHRSNLAMGRARQIVLDAMEAASRRVVRGVPGEPETVDVEAMDRVFRGAGALASLARSIEGASGGRGRGGGVQVFI